MDLALVSETCPENAITTEEREAKPYNEAIVMVKVNVISIKGEIL